MHNFRVPATAGALFVLNTYLFRGFCLRLPKFSLYLQCLPFETGDVIRQLFAVGIFYA